MDGRFLPRGMRVPRQLALNKGFTGNSPRITIRGNLADARLD